MNYAKLTFNSMRITSKGYIYIYLSYVKRTFDNHFILYYSNLPRNTTRTIHEIFTCYPFQFRLIKDKLTGDKNMVYMLHYIPLMYHTMAKVYYFVLHILHLC